MRMLEDYSAFASAAARFHLQNPDLAPGAWRNLLEVIATGFAQTIGDRQFCTLCQHEIHGAQGHDISCPTMMARRIRANEAVQPPRALPPLEMPVVRRLKTLTLPALPQLLLLGMNSDPTPAPHRQEGSGQRTGTGG